jgi:NADP-dependent aldehyde dehydrogenase
MGSINPVFICEDALKTRTEAIAAGLSASVCLGTGQFCTSPGPAIGNSITKLALRSNYE